MGIAATQADNQDSLAAQLELLREDAGLLDRSERGKLALQGPDAIEFLNGQVTNELVGLAPGEGRYAAFLTHKGKMLGDLRILAVSDDPNAEPSKDAEPSELLLDTERVALQALFDMIRRFKVGYDVELHKRTLEYSLFSLIGPSGGEVATRAFLLQASSPSSSQASNERVDVSNGALPYAREGCLPEAEHDHLLLRLGDTPARLIRTDLGFDVLFEADAADALRAALVDARAVEANEDTFEIVRVEGGRPRYGLDLDETTIPQEAALNERAVSFTKGCYVGQETVARLFYKGKPNRHLRGLRLSEPTMPGTALAFGEKLVGSLGSSVLSPRLGPIGLALVRREAEPGATVSVGETGAGAVVVELPFT